MHTGQVDGSDFVGESAPEDASARTGQRLLVHLLLQRGCRAERCGQLLRTCNTTHQHEQHIGLDCIVLYLDEEDEEGAEHTGEGDEYGVRRLHEWVGRHTHQIHTLHRQLSAPNPIQDGG